MAPNPENHRMSSRIGVYPESWGMIRQQMSFGFDWKSGKAVSEEERDHNPQTARIFPIASA